MIPIERGDVDLWLTGTVEQAQSLLRLSPTKVFAAGPAESTESSAGRARKAAERRNEDCASGAVHRWARSAAKVSVILVSLKAT